MSPSPATAPADPEPHAPPAPGPRCYYVHPLLAGRLEEWGAVFEHAAALGFSHIVLAPPFRPVRHGSLLLSATHAALHPDLGWEGDAEAGLARAALLAREAGLGLVLDVVLDRVASGSALAGRADSPFSRPDTSLDPRRFDPGGEACTAGVGSWSLLARFWTERLRRWSGIGIAGFRLTRLAEVPAALVGVLASALAGTDSKLFGWMAGVTMDELAGFEGRGLDYVFSSLPWWDGRGDWFWREDAALRRIAPVIAATEAPFGVRLGESVPHDPGRRAIVQQRRMALAALLGTGWMAVMGNEFGVTRRLDPRRDTGDRPGRFGAGGGGDHCALLARLNELRRVEPVLSGAGALRPFGGAGGDVVAVARSEAPDPRSAGEAALIAVDLGHGAGATIDWGGLCATLGGYHTLELPAGPEPIGTDGYCMRTLHWHAPTRATSDDLDLGARAAAHTPRIAIEGVTPCIDDGRFVARFCVGDRVTVQADLICDGHDMLAAMLRWQAPGDTGEAWREVRMRPIGNDRWQGEFPLGQMGYHRFTVQAWKDEFATFRDELSKKFTAGLDVALEVREGCALIARHRATGAERLSGPVEAQVAALLSDEVAAEMAQIDPRSFAACVEPALSVQAERTAARFASWYEIFPRSMSGDPDRHGTFDDVIAQLPRIRGMGFDVLYFPPIHPIGRLNRKGRNNALVAGVDDPGSPYAIADHTAIHPELGSLADFRRLRQSALDHGLELALDFAVQCAPDHPWLVEHKGWFDWRPDGSIRYAENPPKKYQDIVNVDFYKPDAIDGLWRALCEVVLFWCEQGVRIFRVDNPHTKPLPFWQWLIGAVQARHPDVLFLAEAFTKPKMMNRLAKVGFSQSYTYFTWRNTKAELEQYFTELNAPGVRDYFRPNLFVNTPDINPVFLQNSGRAGHLIRAALAALLGGLWGVYCGFELCEATPLPGREEYADSEKYQIRAWNWQQPGNIVREITRLNWIRRLNPSLQTHLGLTFLRSNNDQVLCFEKATPDRSNVILVAINLDAVAPQDAWFEVPLWRWELPDAAAVEVEDLLGETTTVWRGKMQHVRLDPNGNPYAVWRVRPVEGSIR